MYLFEDLRRHSKEIAQFQIIQDDVDSLVVRMVLTSADTRVCDAVAAALGERCPGFTVRTEVVDRIERRPSGKMLVVENKVLRRSGTLETAHESRA